MLLALVLGNLTLSAALFFFEHGRSQAGRPPSPAEDAPGRRP